MRNIWSRNIIFDISENDKIFNFYNFLISRLIFNLNIIPQILSPNSFWFIVGSSGRGGQQHQTSNHLRLSSQSQWTNN